MDINHDDVWAQRAGLLDSVGTAGGVPDYVHIGREAQNRLDSTANKRLAINNKNPNAHFFPRQNGQVRGLACVLGRFIRSAGECSLIITTQLTKIPSDEEEILLLSFVRSIEGLKALPTHPYQVF